MAMPLESPWAHCFSPSFSFFYLTPVFRTRCYTGCTCDQHHSPHHPSPTMSQAQSPWAARGELQAKCSLCKVSQRKASQSTPLRCLYGQLSDRRQHGHSLCIGGVSRPHDHQLFLSQRHQGVIHMTVVGNAAAHAFSFPDASQREVHRAKSCSGQLKFHWRCDGCLGPVPDITTKVVHVHQHGRGAHRHHSLDHQDSIAQLQKTGHSSRAGLLRRFGEARMALLIYDSCCSMAGVHLAPELSTDD
mmetsp:Transcript_22179/g.37918  ORF Transcript_22179/g.37918 Transcript_22179/m.37918 type:complete len:245 (-) Transcript_22179:49-783(-)